LVFGFSRREERKRSMPAADLSSEGTLGAKFGIIPAQSTCISPTGPSRPLQRNAADNYSQIVEISEYFQTDRFEAAIRPTYATVIDSLCTSGPIKLIEHENAATEISAASWVGVMTDEKLSKD
jgi:hypothetical protein